MIFSLIYEQDHKRIISAVINDSRNTIPGTTNKPGVEIYAYIQAQISQVGTDVLLYRVVGNGSNLGGYAAIQVYAGVATLKLYQLRPAFQQFASEILQVIGIFITENRYLSDFLY